MVKDSLHELSYHVYAGRMPAEAEIKLFNQVYRFWHSIWSKTFKELEGREVLYSDDFDRHDEITVLTSEQQIIGILLLNWYDLRCEAHRSHSYFSAYPELIVRKMLKDGDHMIFTMGNLGVHPEWRKTKVGPLISDLLVGLACKRFLDSDGQRWCSYTRNDRKVNELCYRHGAKCLAADLTEHNVSVDIVSASREEIVVAHEPESGALIEELWAKRVIHGTQGHPPVPTAAPQRKKAA